MGQDQGMTDAEALEVTTRVMRGIVRYRNTGALQVITALVGGLERSSLSIKFMLERAGSMVIVDPDREKEWALTMSEMHAHLRLNFKLIKIVIAAMEAAQNQLEQTVGNAGSNSDHQGSNQPR